MASGLKSHTNVKLLNRILTKKIIKQVEKGKFPMTDNVTQDYIEPRQQALLCHADAMKKAWSECNQFKNEIDILHKTADKEAIDKMYKTTYKEALKKLENICDSMISEAMAFCNAIRVRDQSEEEHRAYISK